MHSPLKRSRSDSPVRPELSDTPGEVSPEAKAKLILLPTKKEIDRVIYLVHEIEKYKMAVNISEKELKELSKKPELASLAKSYKTAITGRHKKPPSSEKKKEEKEIKDSEGKEVKINHPPLQISPRPSTPTPKKTSTQKRREKEKKKKEAKKQEQEQARFNQTLLNRNLERSGPAFSGSLSPLGSNHPMPATVNNSMSSSSSSSSSSYSSSSSMST